MPGLLGEITARGAPIVRRLAVIYAVLDKSPVITLAHLQAALAVWDYGERSAKYLFGGALGDPLADKIYRALLDRAAGMRRVEISEIFSKNKKASEIESALNLLLNRGLARTFKEARQKGRPAEVWQATTFDQRENEA